MQRYRRLWAPLLALVALLSVAGGPALAESAPDRLATLMDNSGLTEQLVQLEETMVVQLKDGMWGGFGSEAMEDRVEGAVRSAYSARKLQQRVRAHLEGGLSDEEVSSVLEWLVSPLGVRITRLEKAASTPEAYRDQAEIEGFLVENMAPARLRRYQRLDQAVGVSELTFTISVNTIVAVTEGLALVAPGVDSPRSEDLRRAFEAQRQSMTEDLREATIRSFAYTYRDLEAADLDRYIEFAESSTGRRYHAVVSAAFERALSEAGRDLGLALGSSATS